MAKTASKTESGTLGTVRKTAAGLHSACVIDKTTMREFDALCLTPVTPMAAEEIKVLREQGSSEMSSGVRQAAGRSFTARSARPTAARL